MKSIRIENVSKSFEGEQVIENLSLTIPSGEFFALLGPSGSGKTTLLRLIAGFEFADKGAIYLDDQDITRMPINERKINTVFQNYALFPHMNVFENVAYGLRVQGMAKQLIHEKVMRFLGIVNLEKYAHKSVRQLSGGQQQRVALARAIITEPDVLLLDEPLAALDLKLREKMLLELIDLQYELKTTFVYVTHDQFEALTVAGSMAIMNTDGEIEQVGTPKNIYEFPASSFVAKFVGTTNMFSGKFTRTGNYGTVAVNGLGTLHVALPTHQEWLHDGRTVIVSVRPEKVEISKQPLTGFSNCIMGEVKAIVYHGRSTQYNVRLANGAIMSVFRQNEEHFPSDNKVIDYDDPVGLYWQDKNVTLLER
jgi:spermidine/putrescine transport system ATP-binding protein